MSGWYFLLFGISFEVMGSFFLKLSHGFNNLVPSILCFVFFAIAIALINMSAKTIDISVVYAIWSGIGIALITLLGVFYFNEVLTLKKSLFIVLIVLGVIGLNAESKVNNKEQNHVNSAE